MKEQHEENKRTENTMLPKKYDSHKRTCQVTFVLPHKKATCASVVGDFNGWDRYAHPMKRHTDGTWRLDLRLEAGQEYQYRFLIDNKEWMVDRNADKYAVHPQGGENSVVAA